MWISLIKDGQIETLVNVRKILGVCRGDNTDIIITTHGESVSVKFASADEVTSALETIQDDFAVNIILNCVDCSEVKK